jgi:hypothetical protein
VVIGKGLERRQTVGRLALATAVVDLIGVVSLIIFFAVGGGPFGFLNDVTNGMVGVLSMVLAWLWVSDRSARWSRVGIAAATAGAVVMVIGSILIIFDITGWYLAGLVSGLGSALIGIWLLIANRLHRNTPGLPRGLIMLGMTAAIFMIIGWLVVPGAVTGIDDPQLAPWYVNAGLLNWMGTYCLYPAWCLWLSRRHGG